MQLKNKKQLAVVILLFLGFTSYAQTELKNTVLDTLDSFPIASASVYIKNTTIGTVTNIDGNFVLQVPKKHENDTLVISSIGYSTFKTPIQDFNAEVAIFLSEEQASLDEVVLIAEARPKTGNEIVVKAIEKLERNLPDSSYIQKGFLRHKERNKNEFKWLIESAITVYDSGFVSSSTEHLKINVDQVRKSYDLRDVDSIFSYAAYKNQNSNKKLKPKDISRRSVTKDQLVKAIKWNDTRVNGLENLFQGKLNLLRNANNSKALFGDDILNTHQFKLDTILVDNERKLYKIKIEGAKEFVGLDTKGIFNEGYKAEGWLYIYYDNYAIKKVEYNLVAASDAQKVRSKRLFDTQTNHKLVITYIEYQDKMYPNYIYYETPKLVNVGLKPTSKISKEEEARYNKEERYYYTVQEILFSEIILNKDEIATMQNQKWDPDIFAPKPYNNEFWKSYNVLLESEEDEQLILDLSRKASLFEQ
ncbi:carboxypeptidase-like regulatory domain-containing protein [Lacinutrix sp. C3R15]|uniref:carboxypeptidase-like regulatory domain-containing protein n=1 Tax=Flavobacteriaceae TaxID=49546 RepID=UPI001C080232|nr:MULTISPECIES: carboxypeptidase-like regulatory domain-containing protein [Flavobacteriaceae]MBU2939630.1 carboxypeptidase-like regulatory domain-containing protein [Lacinutrix sp. C3R15]MDO6622945.1 carboxypeptidase-like regulatory domain-containing protein [Oceanihabitans sp. 1_MG-2023]